MHCRLCGDKNSEESEKHLMNCEVILQNVDLSDDFKNMNYDDIFSDNIEKQICITKFFNKIFKTRDILLNGD